MLSGVEADLVGQAAVDALAGAGRITVSAADVVAALAHPAGLTRAAEYATHLHAKDRLLAAARAVLPEEADRRD